MLPVYAPYIACLYSVRGHVCHRSYVYRAQRVRGERPLRFFRPLTRCSSSTNFAYNSLVLVLLTGVQALSRGVDAVSDLSDPAKAVRVLAKKERGFLTFQYPFHAHNEQPI
jgi:hypothetical protein